MGKGNRHSGGAGHFPCLYGRWCGPGCKGPGRPFDDLDACCMRHDQCYRKRGHFACSCDREFLRCLRRRMRENTAKGRTARMMYLYFRYSPCDPRR